MKRYCKIHGTYEESLFSDACPKCKEADERSEARREEAASLLREARESAERGRQEARESSERDRQEARESAERDRQEAREAQERRDERAQKAREEAEDRAREAREYQEAYDQEALEREEEFHEEAIYKAANPGDYECPFCLFITLRRNARVCVSCKRDIPASYWEARRRDEEAAALAEKRRREAQAEEWKRGEPARQAAAAAAAEAAEKERKLAAEMRERQRILAENAAREAEIKENSKKRVRATLNLLHLIWTVPMSAIAGSLLGFVVGWVVTLIFLRHWVVTFSQVSALGMGTGAILGVSSVAIFKVYRTRETLPGTDHLKLVDSSIVVLIVCGALYLEYLVHRKLFPPRIILVATQPIEKPTTKAAAFPKKKASKVTPEPTPAPIPEPTPVPTPVPTQAFTTRMRMLYSSKYKPLIGDFGETYAVSGTIDLSRTDGKAVDLVAKAASGTPPIVFSSGTIETASRRTVVGEWSCGDLAGAYRMVVYNNSNSNRYDFTLRLGPTNRDAFVASLTLTTGVP